MKYVAIALLVFLGTFIGGCSTAPKTDVGKEQLNNDSQAALKDFEAKDPSLAGFLNSSYGYAIFPSVGKGGLGVGGSYGHGQVYEQGNLVGYCNMEQATIGLQAGGQEFSELIVFENQTALNNFKGNNYSLSAQASAVAMKEGAAAQTKYDHGVAIFTMTRGGLMAEAAVGGQKFNFQPIQ